VITVAVANEKGGVGKTTLAFHLAYAFAPNVQAIDQDQQANLTTRFVRPLPDENNIVRIYERKPCQPLRVRQGIDLVGSDITLSFKEPDARTESAHYLHRALERDWGSHDYAVIDVPPDGLEGLISRLQDMKDALGLRIRIAGIVINGARENTNYAQEVIKEVRAKYGKAIFESVIPESVKVAEAVAAKQPVWEYAPHSKPAHAYLSFIEELKEVIK
jgi:chromosome partitioning protein